MTYKSKNYLNHTYFMIMQINLKKILSSKMFNILLSALTLLICLFLWEIYLRYQYKKEHDILLSQNKNRDLCSTYASDPRLIYTYIPNKCGNNSQGYRDYEQSYEKMDGNFRIVLIGDSVANGDGVELGETFGQLLKKKLNESSDYKNIEVIVLARSGYSTSQELIILENEALKYNPDLIIWSYVLNDPAHPVFHNANGAAGQYFFKPRFHVLHFIAKRLFAKRERWIRKIKNCDKEYHKRLHCVYWDQVELNIAKIGQVSKSNNIPVLFLIHPIFEEGKDFNTYTLTALHKKLTDIASKSGLITLDLLDAFKPYNPDEVKQHSSTWYDPWHPNAKGHMIIADYVYNKTIEKRLIKKSNNALQ
ncbi:MAG: SGNH/GDSL hydrolase family protein [Nitrospirae bacterium]|nr:SGNH/GDSL hydrolase family protein [Nitrospirota bacterium]